MEANIDLNNKVLQMLAMNIIDIAKDNAMNKILNLYPELKSRGNHLIRPTKLSSCYFVIRDTELDVPTTIYKQYEAIICDELNFLVDRLLKGGKL